MKPLTVVTPYSPEPFFEKTLESLSASGLVEQSIIVARKPVYFKNDKCRIHTADSLSSSKTLNPILSGIQTEYLLLFPEPQQVSVELEALERILQRAESTRAGLVYSDYYDQTGHTKTLHPLNDYQWGSVRDDFDFGPVLLFSVSAVRKALKEYGPIPEVQFAGLYDLRLKVSIDHSLVHLQDPLYAVTRNVGANHACTPECVSARRRELPLQNRLFSYVDPKNRAVQKEMERVFTDHLKRIGAYLPPGFKEIGKPSEPFPMEASVIIPVRNREETIEEAVRSALSQEADFPFNIIVVDNHSTDGTTAILSNLAGKYTNLVHMVPARTDLAIGGCWNEALQNRACGRFAVQLDSDDLYSSIHTLQKMVDMLRRGNYAMLIGSYTLVNSKLEQIPPGLIDHREWTDENGHNNALRVNGLGAPRAFHTRLMREIGFLNVSYGEDYAAALRICREYRIGRIYESLYLCRRWPGNTDAGLRIEEENQKNAFKDKVRTDEILARQKLRNGSTKFQIPISK